MMLREVALPALRTTRGSCRSFSTTDGPFKYLKPRFVDRKRRYEDVLITGSVKTLLRAVESCIADPSKQRSKAFWEILTKRCIKSVSLMNYLELGMIGRAFQVAEIQGPKYLKDLKTQFAQEVAKHIRLGGEGRVSGHGALLMVDLLAPVDAKATHEVVTNFPSLMWEMSVKDLAFVVETCAANNVAIDRQTVRRISMKVCAMRETLSIDELRSFVRAFVRWEYRDVRTFTPLALELVKRNPGDEVADFVSQSFEALGIEPPAPMEKITQLNGTEYK
eukprot:GEMP01092812.1.p1 GENE.GEMP01092812.1~~GEMP01092812.1.p1  ORF type:complete len:291 (+),score=54.53 GEMP01092812.1:45-875(+)